MAECLISIGLVTWNSAVYLSDCLRALTRQSHADIELIVVDNASTDQSLNLVRQHWPSARIIANDANTGFCHAHNQAIRASRGVYYMTLNPDVFLMPDFLGQMAHAIELEPSIGQVSGKLYRISDLRQVGSTRALDSTGMFFTPNQRHFDRGSNDIDIGQYQRLEYVFGVSGAAAFYRKTALEDAAVEGQYFDEDFFAYREDADLSWRLQLLGWKALYTPYAEGYHFRSLRSNARRQDLDAAINMHSVKNRFLMRIKNQTWRNGLAFLLPTLYRDLLVLGYVISSERTSIPAFGAVFKLYPQMLRRRRAIMAKRRVSDVYLRDWFRREAIPFTPGGRA